MKRKLIAASMALVLAGAGAVLVQQDPGQAALPLPCLRTGTARTVITECSGVVRKVEERQADGRLVTIWPRYTAR